jgi:hypothetical protein
MTITKNISDLLKRLSLIKVSKKLKLCDQLSSKREKSYSVNLVSNLEKDFSKKLAYN